MNAEQEKNGFENEHTTVLSKVDDKPVFRSISNEVKKMTEKTVKKVLEELLKTQPRWDKKELAQRVVQESGCNLDVARRNILRARDRGEIQMIGKVVTYQSKLTEQLSQLQPKAVETTKTIVEGKNGKIRIVRPEAKNFMNSETINFVKTININIIEKAWGEGIPVMLEGPRGIGKTLAFAKLAEKKNCPLIQIDCSEETRGADFGGMLFPSGDEILFQLGAITAAIDIANKYGEAILVFEEINALLPNAQKQLNQFLDWRGHYYVPKIGKKFQVSPGCKLYVGATGNPLDHGGVYQMNIDLKDRFVVMECNHPVKSQIQTIIKNQTSASDDLINQMSLIWQEALNIFGTGDCQNDLSPRAVVKFTKLYMAGVSLEDLIEMIGTAIGIENKQTFLARLRSAGMVGL